jgi:hypothetical protein
MLISQNGWTALAAGGKAAAFKGDAVLTNGRIMAVARQLTTVVEVYSVGTEGPTSRLRLHLLSSGGEPAERFDQLSLVENTKGTACLEAKYKTTRGDAVAAKFRLKRGDISVQVEPGTGAGRLRVECPSRFVVLPDFFADDIFIDARTIPPDTAELPSENFLLHMVGNGDAIAACVFENNKQDVKIALAGSGQRQKDLGGRAGRSARMARTRLGRQRRRQGPAARLEDAVPRTVARRFHAAQRTYR